MENLLRKKSTEKNTNNKLGIFDVERMEPKSKLENRVYLKTLKEIKDRVDLLDSKVSTFENSNNNTTYWPNDSNPIKHQELPIYSNQLNSEFKKLHDRISSLEKKIEERIPEKVLSESRFRKEVQEGDDIVQSIITEIRELLHKKPMIPVDETLTLVERKRIDKIRELLKRHEKLSSKELSDLINLSRTRCNEYFKKMESLGLVKSVLEKRKKFYKLRH
jgi:predicted transcriptional regulator